MGWACDAYGRGEGVYRVLVGKSEGNSLLRRPRRRWMDNNRMDLQEVGCGYMDWIGLAQDRDKWRTLVSTVMNLRFREMRGISWLAANQLASQEGLCTMEQVSKLIMSRVCYVDNIELQAKPCCALSFILNKSKISRDPSKQGFLVIFQERSSHQNKWRIHAVCVANNCLLYLIIHLILFSAASSAPWRHKTF